MSRVASPPSQDAAAEVSALIDVLHTTDERLDELLAGEVDAVTDRHGRTILLRRAQEHLRDSEAAKQAAILSALPAHIALLDSQAVISSVNEAWRRFARTGVPQAPGYEVGVNYLDACDRAVGNASSEAAHVAAGIRSVLVGEANTFSIEYPCHSGDEERWFQMTVTPLSDAPRNGAVVMHVNISLRKMAETALRESETEFRTMAESMPQMVWITKPDGWNIYYNQHWMDYTGLTREESEGFGWLKPFHPEDQARAKAAWQRATATHSTYSLECRLRRADGAYRWWLIRKRSMNHVLAVASAY